MSKKEKKNNLIEENETIVENKSISTIVSKDKNKISDATTEAKKTIDSVAYADNLVPPNKKSKSIRSLNIEEKLENKIEGSSTNQDLSNEFLKDEDINNNSSTFTEKEEKTAEYENIKNISSNKDDNIVTKKSHKNLLIISFSLLAIFLLLFVFSTIFALITSYKTTIIHGIKIKDIDVSGLTKEEAILKVSSALKEKLEKQITLKHNDYSITVFPEQFDVSFKIEEAVNMAYSKGRTRKCFSEQL